MQKEVCAVQGIGIFLRTGCRGMICRPFSAFGAVKIYAQIYLQAPAE